MAMHYLEHKPGLRGLGGAGGSGGAGGVGGMGGMGHSWTTEERHGDRVETRHHTHPGGFSGPHGFPGNRGRDGIPGMDGNCGHLQIIVTDTQ